MWNALLDFCGRRGVPERNKNISGGFQNKSVTFPSHAIIEREQSIKLSVDILTQNTQWVSSGSKIRTKHFDFDCPSNSESFLQYSSAELKECDDRTTGKSLAGSSTRLLFLGGQNIAETDESGMSIYHTKPYATAMIRGESFSFESANSDTSPLVKERIRSNAIEIKPVDSPGGIFCKEKQFYVQNQESVWEIVNIERWNPWNGTWQVKGADSVSFPAAPIALKSKEQYEFLSRERIVEPRSFGSCSETASI